MDFVLAYGLTPRAFQRKEPSKSLEECNELFDKFWSAAPVLAKFLQKLADDGVQNRYARCYYTGRRDFFYKLDFSDSGQYNHARNISKNYPFQSGNVAFTKRAVVQIRKRIKKENWNALLVNIVYDEVVYSVIKDQAEAFKKVVEEEMLAAAHYYMKNVPMEVEAALEPSWSKP